MWHRGHPRFATLALLGSLHLVLRRRGSERVLNHFIERESYHDRTQVPPRTVTWVDWLRPAEGRADWHRVARRIDHAPRLREIAVPTLLLCGRYDPQYPLPCSEELAAGIRHGELIRFEHSGHYPFLEELAAFWAAVGSFLAAPIPDRGVKAYRRYLSPRRT